MRQARRSLEGRLVRAALLVLTASPAAYGVIGADWNKPAGGTWTDPTNWTSNVVPGASDTAAFELGSAGGYVVTVPGPATAVNMIGVIGDRIKLAQGSGSTMTIGSVNLGGISPQPASITFSGGVFSTGFISSSYTPASADVNVTAGTNATLGGIMINGDVAGHIRIDGPGTTVNAGQISAGNGDVSLTNGARVTTGSGWFGIGGGTFVVDAGASLDTGNGWSNLSNVSVTVGSSAANRSAWTTTGGSLTRSNVDINAGGDVTTRGITLDVDSSITVHVGGTYTDHSTVGGTGTLRLDGGTAYLYHLNPLPHGTLAGFGTIHASTFDPGGWTVAPDGTIAFDPGVTDLEANGSTRFVFDITSADDYDRLTSIHSMRFRGMLSVSADPSYVPVAGDTFQLFSFDLAVPGTKFFSINLPTLQGFTWDTSALYTTGAITVVVPEPGTLMAAAVGAAGLLAGQRRRGRGVRRGGV